MNGLVYRAQSPQDDLAVKFARRDARNRAFREYTVTKALHDADLNISPRPLHLCLDDADLPGDAIVSTWLPGKPLVMPPPAEDRAIWEAILDTLAQIHHVTPTPDNPIPNAAMFVRHPIDLINVIETRLARLPGEEFGDFSLEQIKSLFDALVQRVPHHWDDEPPLTLVHCDSHPANMLLHDGKIALVDWEGSGWSDPAFDISNMTSFWRYFDLPEAHFDWLHTEYARHTGDATLRERVRVYATIQNVHWVVMHSHFVARQQQGRMQGAHTHTLEHQLEYQRRYWERAWRLVR